MAYENREELKKHIGKFGIFFNDETDKGLKIGTLVAVTANGNCEDENEIYFDEFEPKSVEEIQQMVQEYCNPVN